MVVTEPLTREQLLVRRSWDGADFASFHRIVDSALHYEARLREVEGLLPDVDEALGKYGMAVTSTGGPPMGSDEKRQAFEDARLALRRVRDTLARRL